MTCQQIKEKFPDYLIGDLDQKNMKDVQSHLATCHSCREELESLSAIWTKLGVLPEEQPSPTLRNNFYSMLEEYKQGLEKEKSPSFLRAFFERWKGHLWPSRPAFQISFALIFLVVGLAGGYILNSSRQSSIDLAHLRQEVQSMRQTLAVSLLEKSSPGERLRGVSLSYDMEQPGVKLIDALIHTLNHDSNVNVRLAAVDALYLFYKNPVVRENLIDSLNKQDSPLVQIALVDLIVTMRERRAIESLKLLVQNEELNPDVKQRIEQGIQQISF